MMMTCKKMNEDLMNNDNQTSYQVKTQLKTNMEKEKCKILYNTKQ